MKHYDVKLTREEVLDLTQSCITRISNISDLLDGTDASKHASFHTAYDAEMTRLQVLRDKLYTVIDALV